MIRSCNIAVYYRLIIYSNIKDVGSGSWNNDVGFWGKKSLVDKLKDSTAGGKTKSRAWLGSRVSC